MCVYICIHFLKNAHCSCHLTDHFNIFHLQIFSLYLLGVLLCSGREGYAPTHPCLSKIILRIFHCVGRDISLRLWGADLAPHSSATPSPGYVVTLSSFLGRRGYPRPRMRGREQGPFAHYYYLVYLILLKLNTFLKMQRYKYNLH